MPTNNGSSEMSQRSRELPRNPTLLKLKELAYLRRKYEIAISDYKTGMKGWHVKHRDVLLDLREWVNSWPDD